MAKTGNKGEWSEIYIFLKLLADGKVYAADKNLKKIPTAFLNILKIIREEVAGHQYHYTPGQVIHIYLNGEDTGVSCSTADIVKQRDCLWKQLLTQKGAFALPDVEQFLNGIFITELKSPPIKNGKFHGGTEDIVMQVSDYKTGLSHVVGFSCKSEFAGKATLFNPSKDNTNFVYKIEGPIDDALMDEFNNTFRVKNTSAGQKREVAIALRMGKLKDAGCTLKFVKPYEDTTETNLVLSGGMELPEIVGEMLRHFYLDGNGSRDFCSLTHAIENLSVTNPIGYKKSVVNVMYRKKVSDLLYDMFTGMKMGSAWDGKRSVNGGYIVVLNDGDVLAYHSCLEDEFKEFLVSRLGFDAPSCTRHLYMTIYKDGGDYFLKLNLQVRFVAQDKSST